MVIVKSILFNEDALLDIFSRESPPHHFADYFFLDGLVAVTEQSRDLSEAGSDRK